MLVIAAEQLIGEPPMKRYEVTAYDYRVHRRITIAWSDDRKLADELATGAEACPTLADGKVADHFDNNTKALGVER